MLSEHQPDGRFGRLTTQLVTNAMKLSGLVIAVHELLIRGTLRPVVAAEAAFMMAGGRLSEHLILSLLDRMLGHSPPPEQPGASADPPAGRTS